MDSRRTWIPEEHGLQGNMDSRGTWILEEHEPVRTSLCAWACAHEPVRMHPNNWQCRQHRKNKQKRCAKRGFQVLFS